MKILKRVGSGFMPAALILSALLVTGCGSEEGGGPTGERVIPVSAWTVEEVEVEVRRHWTGRLEPLRTVAVQAPRAGRVDQVLAMDGDLVQAGDVLVRMTGPDLDARLGALRGQVRQREDELARWERLARAGAAGSGEVAEATLRLLAAQEQLDEVEAGVDAYLVRSPASGRVSLSTVGPAAMVAGGQTLMQVDDRSTWGVHLLVAPSEVGYLEQIEQLTISDDRGETFEIQRVSITSDLHPSLVRVDLQLAGAVTGDHRGAEVSFMAREQALLLPWTAVAGDGDRHWVALVVPGEPSRVERRMVELGRAHPGGVEVLIGLEAGDQVIRYEPRSHPEGRAVRPEERGR